MANTGFHLAFAVRIPDTTGQRDGAIVCQHVAIERIHAGIVDVRREYAFLEVVEHHDSGRSAQATEGLLMQLGPDARAGMEAEKPDALAAEAERQHEKTCAPVLAGLRVANHGTGTVIDLRLLTRRGLDDRTRFRRLRAAQFADVALDAFVGAPEAVLVHQLLPDGHGVAAMRQGHFDEIAPGLAGTGGWTVGGFRPNRAGGHLAGIGRFCGLRAGGHLVGRFCFPPAPAAGCPYGNARSLQISGCGLPANAGGLLNPTQRPAQLAQRDDLFLLLFVQDIAHADGGYSSRPSQCPDYVLIGRFSGDHHWPVLGDRRGSDQDHWWPRTLGEALSDRGILRQDRTELEDRLESLAEQWAGFATTTLWGILPDRFEPFPAVSIDKLIQWTTPEVGGGLARAIQRCSEQNWYGAPKQIDDFISLIDYQTYLIVSGAELAFLSQGNCQLLELVQQIYATQAQIALRDDLIVITNLVIAWCIRQLRLACFTVINQQRAFFTLHSFHPPHSELLPTPSAFGEFALAA